MKPRRPDCRFIVTLPPVKKGAWKLKAVLRYGKTWIVAVHPEHRPVAIEGGTP